MTTIFRRNQKQTMLKQVNQLAWLLDNSIQLPLLNYRIGLESLLGLIPVLGDLAGLLISSYIVIQALRLGVSRPTIMRMITNVLLETLLGAIPIFGDIFDATFKANLRNAKLLNEAVG